MSSSEKKRYWGIVAYPESLPSNWKQILIDTGLPIAISPLHDRDINEGVGELKKPHYHFIICYPGPTTFNNVNKLCQELNTVIPKPIESVKGAYEYLCHLNNPEKVQYDKNDIVHLNGFDPKDFKELTAAEKRSLRRQALEIIKTEKIFEYYDLVEYCDNNGLDDLSDLVCSSTIFFNSVINSKRHKVKDKTKELAETYHTLVTEHYKGVHKSDTEKKLLELFGEFEEFDQAE